MARFLYNLSLTLLYPFYATLALLGLAPNKIGLFFRSRQNSIYKLNELHRSWQEEGSKGKLFWFHAASAGELDQIRAIIREIRPKNKAAKIIVSVFSLSVKNLKSINCDLSVYLPLDVPWRWSLLDPDFSVDVFATSTWDVFPNLLRKLSQRNTACFLINAALPADSSRLTHAWFFRNHYRDLTGIFAVDEENAKRFRKLYSGPVETAGDSRYDTVMYRLQKASLPKEKKAALKTKNHVFILASTYSACDHEIFPWLSQWLNDYKNFEVWIFPHHIDEQRLSETESELSRLSVSSVRFSQLVKNPAKKRPRAVVVDEMGILAFAYSFADLCYVGGAFHNRVHNTAEPAGAGLPVLTGPRIEASPVAVSLEQAGALRRSANGDELKNHVYEFSEKPRLMKKTGKTAKDYLKSNTGAAKTLAKKMNLY